jgi:hypothetical protein
MRKTIIIPSWFGFQVLRRRKHRGIYAGFTVSCGKYSEDFTLVKIQMRLPGLVWSGIAMEAALGRKRLVSLRYIQLGKIRAAARIGCPF